MAELLASALAEGRLGGSGAVVAVAVAGEVVSEAVVGSTMLPSPAGEGRAGAPPLAVTTSTLYDVASITKLFTAAALLLELDARGLDASLPVAEVLPEFRTGAARGVAVRDLLAHTAGFAPDWRAVGAVTPAAAREQFRRTRPVGDPGRGHRYSCIGYIWAGLLLEELAGDGLDAVVASRVAAPLGLTSTGFRPAASHRGGIAATEVQPGRGLVHGQVHDEAAWALGGVAGNAGLFSTAPDLLRFAEALRTGGMLDGRRVLPAGVVAAMTSPTVEGPGYGQALGPRIDEAWMLPPQGHHRVGHSSVGHSSVGHSRVGHTGFTGTSLVTEPGGEVSIVFLSNRVHPSRNGPDIAAVRTAVSRAAAEIRGEAS